MRPAITMLPTALDLVQLLPEPDFKHTRYGFPADLILCIGDPVEGGPGTRAHQYWCRVEVYENHRRAYTCWVRADNDYDAWISWCRGNEADTFGPPEDELRTPCQPGTAESDVALELEYLHRIARKNAGQVG